MIRFLCIVMLLGACDSSSSKIRLSPGSSADSGAGVPDRDVIVVKPADSKTISIEESAPPGNLDEEVQEVMPPPPPPPPPTVTIRDIDAKLPKDASWVAASGGVVPPDSLAGGSYLDSLSFICRAKHGEAYLPGQLVVSTGLCYVADGTAAIGYSSYEVLTYIPDDVSLGFRTTATTIGAIPTNSMGLGLKAGKVQHVCLVTVGVDRYVGRAEAAGGGCLYVDIPTVKATLTTTYSMVVTAP